MTAKPLTIIYHAHCADGFTAAWAVWTALSADEQDTARVVAAKYGDAPPDVTGRQVAIVDFSYPREQLLAMHDQSNHSMVVLDHHKTAAAALEGLDFCVFDMNRSGAGLAWDHFHGKASRPWIVDYVEDRDLWRFALPQSKDVNAYLQALPKDNFAAWSTLSKRPLHEIAEAGRAITMTIDGYVASMVPNAIRRNFCEFQDIPIVNAPPFAISELVGTLAESAPFAVGWFQRGDGKYQYSLRSRGADGADVSEIASRFPGGGGHKNAAGFTLETVYS